jgi:hypothetical protein
MSFGCGLLASWESRAIGLDWGNLGQRVSSSDPLTMSNIFVMLILGKFSKIILRNKNIKSVTLKRSTHLTFYLRFSEGKQKIVLT